MNLRKKVDLWRTSRGCSVFVIIELVLKLGICFECRRNKHAKASEEANTPALQ